MPDDITSLRKARQSLVCSVLAAVIGCGTLPARADRPPAPEDPIIIPEAAVAVDQMSLIGKQRWIPLNHRMLLAEVGTKYFLLVFDESCMRLTQRNAVLATRTNDSVLNARTDVIYVDTEPRNQNAEPNAGNITGSGGEVIAKGFPCQIDRMYSILEEDAIALREQTKK
jgi:Family of unknown function (DUF6491)